MFNKDKHNKNPTAIKPLNELIESEPKEPLLNSKKNQELFKKIQDAMDFDDSTFQNMAMPLIERVFKYCQKLPEPAIYYSHFGGLFDLALNRTEAAMQLLRQVLVLDNDKKPSEEQRLWQHALFSAAMLQGLGKLYTDYHVEIYDKYGYFIKSWQPLLESIITVGKYYNYEFLDGDDIELRNSITPIIARRIIPKAAFERILSDKKVFATWLALLREDKDSVLGPLAAILERANDIAIQRDMQNFVEQAKRAEGNSKRLGTFVDKNNDLNIDKEKLLGAEFILWVTESIEKGNFILNQDPALVEVREASVVLHPSVLDIYMQEHKKLKNRVAMQQAFLAWNMHLLTDAAKKSFKLSGEKGLGHITVNKAILPNSVLLYNAKTDKISKVSSLELISNIGQYNKNNPSIIKTPLSHLTKTGQWLAGEENVSSLQNQPKNKV